MGVQAMRHVALLQAWSGQIAECSTSGKTVKAWCEAEGVFIKTYYYWEKRIVEEASQQANLPVTPQSSMLMRVNPETLSDEDKGSREACFTIRHAAVFLAQFLRRGSLTAYFETTPFPL